MISKDIYESLGDKAYSELQKKSKDHKPKMKTIWDNKPWPLKGSYSNQQLLDLGFVKFDGGWKVPQSKFDELSEMTLRVLKTGKNKIPKVGEKKTIEEEQLEEGKKFPRTSEFLQVKELAEIKRLAGVYEPYQTEGDESMGSNISKTASQISKIMREKNIQPGTPEWFQLWFSKPYLTGEKPTGD